MKIIESKYYTFFIELITLSFIYSSLDTMFNFDSKIVAIVCIILLPLSLLVLFLHHLRKSKIKYNKLK